MELPITHKPKGLAGRVYYLTAVAALFTVGRRDEASWMIQRGVQNDRVPGNFFAELFLHLSLLLGFPTMLDGLTRLHEFSSGQNKRRKKQKETEGDVRARGKRTLVRVYGKATNRLLTNLASLHELVPSVIVRDAYGRIISRRGMSLRERELVNVVVLSIQRLDRQLFSHLRGALRVGVQPRTLRDAIHLTARIAGNNPDTPLKMLASLTATRRRSR